MNKKKKQKRILRFKVGRKQTNIKMCSQAKGISILGTKFFQKLKEWECSGRKIRDAE